MHYIVTLHGGKATGHMCPVQPAMLSFPRTPLKVGGIYANRGLQFFETRHAADDLSDRKLPLCQV